MNAFTTIAEAICISFSLFLTGTCFCWLANFHRLRIKELDAGLYEVIYKEMPGSRRSVKAWEMSLVLMGLVITASNCAYISTRPSIFIACANMLAALLLLTLENRHFAFVKSIVLLSTYHHHVERLRQLNQFDEPIDQAKATSEEES